MPYTQDGLTLTPTLLPDLKFHDLVFGHELGSGAFSTVKYAKLIQPGKSAPLWPEYAVKVIKTELIRERSYEMSVQREITALQMLSHPGVARLIASFRWHEGAFLVLEYGAGGDLHTRVRPISGRLESTESIWAAHWAPRSTVFIEGERNRSVVLVLTLEALHTGTPRDLPQPPTHSYRLLVHRDAADHSNGLAGRGVDEVYCW